MMNPKDNRPVLLLVEDEALTIMDLGELLESEGYDTIQCASADRALSIARSHPEIQALLTDVQLSGDTDGFDLATSIAKLRPNLPILIFSGRAAPDPARMPTGAEFIARPCSGEDILARLGMLMARR